MRCGDGGGPAGAGRRARGELVRRDLAFNAIEQRVQAAAKSLGFDHRFFQ